MLSKPPKTIGYLLLPFAVGACSATIEQVDLAGETMGTTYTAKMIGEGVDGKRIRNRLEAVLDSINSQMSTWRPDSEISRFNNMRTTDWFEVSDEFLQVLQAARKINRLTNGAFDVTIGELVELWGFGSVSRYTVPDPGLISDKLRHTGPAKFEVDPVRKAIRKTDPETRLDLSGIAKGYAVDALAGVIDKADIEHFLVEIGGEVRASGRRMDGLPWRVATEKPDTHGRSVQFVIELDNAAIATSGDYRDFFEVESKRYSHIIDPKTGRPPEHATASVSIVAENAMTADALATGFMVLGGREALALAEKNGLAAFILERYGESFDVQSSARFELISKSAGQKK